MIDILRKKRHGHELSAAEIHRFVSGYTRGEIPEHQAAAWLMASVIQGLSRTETAHLTEAMLRSGITMDLSHLPAKKVDKHSTGGVGDKTSLIIAPVVAAAGLVVPMSSGRGLGHTGGTLDKLEAIPGFRVALSTHEFRAVLERCGCAMISQTDDIAPADRKLYDLRHFTSTIDHPSLICASIMSKKLAEGIDALVLDVKTGSGAFMKQADQAVHLAELMVETGERMGVRVVALVTGMDQPLGRMIGNALELVEVLEVLRGGGPDDLRSLSLELAGWMLMLGGRVRNVEAGRGLAEQMIASGQALERLRIMVALQGGDPTVVDEPGRLSQAEHHSEFKSTKTGFLAAIDCERLGMASVVLGAGREHAHDEIDHAVGFEMHKKLGDYVKEGAPLLTIFYNSEERRQRAEGMLQTAFTVSEDRLTNERPLIRQVIQNAVPTS